MNQKERTRRKLASLGRAAEDQRLTDLQQRLLCWLVIVAAGRNSGIAKRSQAEMAKAIGAKRRAVQEGLNMLVACGYLYPLPGVGRGSKRPYDVCGGVHPDAHLSVETADEGVHPDAHVPDETADEGVHPDAHPSGKFEKSGQRTEHQGNMCTQMQGGVHPDAQSCAPTCAHVPCSTLVFNPSGDDRETDDRPAPRQRADALGAGLNGQQQGKGLSEGSQGAPPEPDGDTDRGEALGDPASKLGALLRGKIGADKFATWRFDTVEQVSLADGVLLLAAPELWIAHRIRDWYATDLEELSGAQRVKVIVRKAASESKP